MNTPVPVTQTAIANVVGKDVNGNTKPLGSLSLTISNYSAAYIAPYPAAGPNGFILVPKDPAQVGTLSVDVTSSATDINGAALPPAVLSFDLVGAAVPDPAVSVEFGGIVVGGFVGVPSDPGSGTITF